MARRIPKTKPQLPHYGATKNGCELNRNRLMRRGQDYFIGFVTLPLVSLVTICILSNNYYSL